MDYAEFKRNLCKAGLSIKDFANLAKINPNSLTNYAQKGYIPNHWAIIAALLSEMAEHDIDFLQVFSKIDLAPNKPRGNDSNHFRQKNSNPQK